MSSLARKGFSEDAGGRHKRFTYVRLSGLKTNIFTVTSHGRSGADITAHLVSSMAKQCRVDKETFAGLVSCNVGQEDYEAALIQLGEIPDCVWNFLLDKE